MGCGSCRKQNGRNVPAPQMVSKAPTLHPDGCIEFKMEPVPEVEGYTRDADNPMVLVPKAVPCVFRMTGIMLQRNGVYKPHHVCRESKCEHRSKEVTLEICAGCPFRQDD